MFLYRKNIVIYWLSGELIREKNEKEGLKKKWEEETDNDIKRKNAEYLYGA